MNSSPDLAGAREALTLAKERYPAPLAHVAGELLYELSAPRPNYMRCFLLEIDLFEVSVAFFAFIQLAELARRGKARASEAAVRQLRDNPILSTGHWWGLLREASRDLREGNASDATAVAQELAGLYFDTAGRPSKLGAILDKVPGLRNRVKGHGWTLTDEQYEKHAVELLESSKGCLSYLDGLANHVLFLCAGCEEDAEGCRLDLVELQGDSRRPHRRTAQGYGPFRRGQVYIASKDQVRTGRLDADTVLCLHPFVQVRARDGRPDALYLLQALHKDHAELRGIVGSDTVACPTSLPEARGALDRLLPGLGPGRFDKLRQAVAQVDRETLDSPHGRVSYNPERYFVRPGLLRRVDDFLTSGAPAALLAGPSGMGKTALACHLTDRWLVSAERDRCVLLVLAHEVAAAGDSLDEWCRRRLAHSLDQVRDAAAEAKAQVLVVLDGVDRLAEPTALVEALARSRNAPPGALRFLFTTAETGLPAVATAQGGQDVRPGRIGNPEGVPGDLPVLAIPPLDGAEARRVYDLFRGPGGAEPASELLEALTTPLLLRLAHAALSSGAHPDLGAGQVLLAYAERVVFGDLPRTALINRLADEMLASGARTVPVAALAGDSALAPVLLADGPEAPLRALVREGILCVERLPSGDKLPLPGEPHVSFTFDYLRDFVIFTRLAPRFNEDQASLRGPARAAGPASPLIGGLRFLIQERLRGADHEETLGGLVAFVVELPPVPQRALLHQLLTLPVGRGRPLAELLQKVFMLLTPAGKDAFLEAAAAAFDRLERKGQVKEAGELCDLTADLALKARPHAVLPLLFDWSRLQLRAVSAAAAAATAEAGSRAAEALQDRSLRAEALTCLDEALEAQAEQERRREVRARLREEAPEGLSPRAEHALRLWEWVAFQHEQPARARAALERARRLAIEHRQPRWHAQAALAELRRRMPEERYDCSRETAALVEEALQAAQRAGYPGLEAEARRRASWHQKCDLTREVEAGLEAAEAAGDLAARAGLLRARAHGHVLRGRFEEAARDGAEAAHLLQRLHYRYRYLKTLQHLTAICEWELGRSGRALAMWRELLEGFPAIGKFREAALSALLVAELACELGKADEAAKLIEQARRLAAQAGPQHGLNFGMAEALLLRRVGQAEEAVATLERARQWGKETRYPDFIFQPGILAVRFLLERGAGDPGPLECARRILNEMLEDPSIQEEHRNRYAGELYSLYALYNLERKAPEEAGLWLEKADRWFADRPAHRAAPEWRAIKLLAGWVTAEALAQGSAAAKGRAQDGLQQKARGLRTKVERGVEPQVLRPLQEMAGTFADPEEGRAFVEHHPARLLLLRHGIPVPAGGGE
jgi:hypothetical protein